MTIRNISRKATSETIKPGLFSFKSMGRRLRHRLCFESTFPARWRIQLDIAPMLLYSWASVCDACPTLNQHRVISSCLLDASRWYLDCFSRRPIMNQRWHNARPTSNQRRCLGPVWGWYLRYHGYSTRTVIWFRLKFSPIFFSDQSVVKEIPSG